MQSIVAAVVNAFIAYAAIGLLLAIVFVTRGVHRIDDEARGSGMGFPLIILPGVTGLWESVYIVTTLGIEPWGRIGSGVVELIASILLLVPRTVAMGATLSLGVISGALVSHVTKLGIALRAVGDNVELFALAVVVFVSSVALLFLHRREVPLVRKRAAAA